MKPSAISWSTGSMRCRTRFDCRPRAPGCVKTPTSNFRVEILSRLRWIGKELLCQSSPKEEKGENNSAHSLLARVFTQPRSKTEVSGLARHVRFTLRSRYRQPAPACPFGAKDRDRGEPRGSAPPTPPYVRVRIRRFEKLR